MKILFCNVAFMKYYRGITPGVDEPSTVGLKAKDIGDIEEQFNFLSCNMEEKDVCLGFFSAKTGSSKTAPQVHIEKIDGVEDNADFVDNVLVIWCAKKESDNRTVVVGWYKNARVYRYYQEAIFGEGEDEFHQLYNVVADAQDCVLLPLGERSRYTRWNVPRKKGANGPAFGFGSANMWYANEDKSQEFVKNMVDRIKSYNEENWMQKEIEA